MEAESRLQSDLFVCQSHIGASLAIEHLTPEKGAFIIQNKKILFCALPTLSMKNLKMDLPIIGIFHFLEEGIDFALLLRLGDLVAGLVISNMLLIVVPLDWNVSDRVAQILE